MEKIIAFSVAGFTLLTSTAAQLFKVVLACMLLSCIASFQDLCSFFSLLLRALLFMFSLPHRYFLWLSSRRDDSAIADADDDDDDDDLFGEEIEKVVERLMNRSSEEEVLHLFDEREPSFEEIKETFDVFDNDGDGYIDEKDLEKLLFRMGFREFSRRDCGGMIRAFDDSKDGRIDFEEFLKLMEDSFD